MQQNESLCSKSYKEDGHHQQIFRRKIWLVRKYYLTLQPDNKTYEHEDSDFNRPSEFFLFCLPKNK
jgi:hypothetical protein